MGRMNRIQYSAVQDFMKDDCQCPSIGFTLDSGAQFGLHRTDQKGVFRLVLVSSSFRMYHTEVLDTEEVGGMAGFFDREGNAVLEIDLVEGIESVQEGQ